VVFVRAGRAAANAGYSWARERRRVAHRDDRTAVDALRRGCAAEPSARLDRGNSRALGAGLSGDRSVRTVARTAVGEDTHGTAGRFSRGVERSAALQAGENSGAYAHRPWR